MSVDSTSISLLRRLRNSANQEDWARFTNLYAPLVFHWGRSQGLDANDAADLVQEVMTKLVVKLRDFKYDPNLKFRGWLRVVSVNQARDIQRLANRYKTFALTEQHDSEQADGNAVDLFDQREYSAYLVTRGRDLIRAEFEPTTWEACWMYAVDGKSATQVAQELGITANAVRIAKCRVFARLRKELEGLIE